MPRHGPCLSRLFFPIGPSTIRGTTHIGEACNSDECNIPSAVSGPLQAPIQPEAQTNMTINATRWHASYRSRACFFQQKVYSDELSYNRHTTAATAKSKKLNYVIAKHFLVLRGGKNHRIAITHARPTCGFLTVSSMDRIRQAASVADLSELRLLIVGSHTPESNVSHTPVREWNDGVRVDFRARFV